MEATVREGVLRRIERRGKTPHVDLFDFVLPLDDPVPTNRRELIHIGAVAQQMMFANFGPMADWYYGTFVFLLQEPEYLRYLCEEVRGKFETYDEIVPSALTATSLPFLHACLEESLRLLPGNNTGLPRLSPGGIVDGHYVPKGVGPPFFLSLFFTCPPQKCQRQRQRQRRCQSKKSNFYSIYLIISSQQTHVQTSIFALSRSPRFFHDPRKFRPQRWLSSSSSSPPSNQNHPLHDPAFANNDDLKAFHPFSLGPRACIGRELAWMEAKLLIVKVLWRFDVVGVSGEGEGQGEGQGEGERKGFDLEGKLKHFGFLVKPELRVRFVERRDGDF